MGLKKQSATAKAKGSLAAGKKCNPASGKAESKISIAHVIRIKRAYDALKPQFCARR